MPNRRVIRVAHRLTVAIVVALAISGGTAAAAAGPTATTGPVERVVVVAVPSLAWPDLSATATPHLWQFAGRAARGALSVKAAGSVSRCAAALTTLGAGNRATATPALERGCATGAETADPALWNDLRRANRRQRFGTQPGALAEELAAHGHGTAAVGGVGALLAAAQGDGQLAPGPPVLIVVENSGLYAVAAARRASALRAVDADLARWLDPTPPDTLTLVVGAGDRAHGRAGLRVAMASGPGFGPGRLTSDSTGRAPYVELIDVAPTVLSALGLPPPASMDGERWRVSAHATGLARDTSALVDISRHAAARSRWGGSFVRALVILGTATCVAALLLFLGFVRRRGVSQVVEGLGYAAGALPVSAYALQVLPWWRWPVGAWVAVIVGLDALLVALAFVAARRRPPWGGLTSIAVVTAVALAVDLLTGTHLQLDGLLGDSTTVAGRFHGAGNTDFAVFATAALLSAGAVAIAAARRGRTWVVVLASAVGVVAVVLDGAPTLGDDLGGVIALAPAVAVLALLLLGVRLGPRVWIAAAAVGVGAAVALVGYDLVVGGGHVGRFAGEAGQSGARTTIDRKLAANLGSWHRSDYVAVVIFGLAAVAVAARGPLRSALGRADGMRAALIAAAICAVIGGAVNDSGVVVPGAAAVVGVPLLLAGCLRAERMPP